MIDGKKIEKTWWEIYWWEGSFWQSSCKEDPRMGKKWRGGRTGVTYEASRVLMQCLKEISVPEFGGKVM